MAEVAAKACLSWRANVRAPALAAALAEMDCVGL